jgi:Alpha-L-arabinofuranosidase
MRKFYTVLSVLILLGFRQINCLAQVNMSIDFSNYGIAVSPNLYGIFFEDINFAADGGLYAELIRNRSFEESTNYWEFGLSAGCKGSMAVETQNLLNSAQTGCLKLTADSLPFKGSVRVMNSGFWGINVVNRTEYSVSFYAKCSKGFDGAVTVSLVNSDGSYSYAQQRIAGLTTDWKKYTCTLVSSGSNALGKFSLSINALGSVWVDVVSVFPPTFNNRPNGLRVDLAQKLKDMHPKFMRFPGGCFVEGANMATGAFRWKETVGPIEERPGHANIWGYRTSDGMGYHEFLQLCEDIGAIPLYVCNAGMSHGGDVSIADLNPWIQDALNAIEYANGDTSTVWGHKRKLNGHPQSFNLKYIEIGNEEWYEPYSSHYNMFYDSIKAYYPDIITISNNNWSSLNHIEVYDYHNYSSPDWFATNSNIFDNLDRKGPKVYVGEYAVTVNGGMGNTRNAVGEACFMTGMERNSDAVIMASYAPLFGNVNQCQWNPNAIYYNAATSYGTPSYYVQKMFTNNTGNVYIPIRDSLNYTANQYAGAVGLGTWVTQCQYDSISVQSKDSLIVNENFDSSASNWKVYNGTWGVNGGVYQQTSLNTDCRSTVGNITLPNFTYHLKAKKLSGNEGFLIIFGYADDNNYYWWNIGGWNNTLSAVEHAVGGAKSTLVSTPYAVTTNKWYDIRIEVSNGMVSCYLDNVLIHKFSGGIRSLYSSCTVDSTRGDIYLKVVNFSDSARTARIQMKNLPANTSLEGSLQYLTYTDVYAENSISSPNKIVPVTSVFSSVDSGFQYTFAKNSVNVFHLYPQSSVIHANNSVFSIPENSPKGYFVGTMAATGGTTLKYRILNSSVNGAFSINDSTGVINVADSSLLNYEVNPSISLEIQVEDSQYDTVPPARGMCTVNLTDVNEKPSLIASKYYAFVKDAVGSVVGKVYVRDEDKGQSYTFSIKSQSAGNLLSINSASGELTISDNSNLSGLVGQTITFIVDVSDNGTPSLSDEKEYTLEILNNTTISSVNVKTFDHNVEVFPNPVNNYLILKLGENVKNINVNIVNTNGVVVYSQKNLSDQNVIPTTNLSNGTYFIQLISNGQVIASKSIEILK